MKTVAATLIAGIKVGDTSIKPRRHPPPVFEFGKQIVDFLAQSKSSPVEVNLSGFSLSWMNAGCDFPDMQGLPEPLAS